MNYLLRNKSKFPHRAPIIATLVLFVLLSLSAFFFSNIMRSGLYTISRPLWLLGGLASKSFVSVKTFFVFKNSLIEKNISLQDEVSSLKLKQFDYDILLQENQDLKSEFGRENQTDRVISRILSKPPLSPYDTFIIDAGSNQGISSLDKVYISDSIIIGLVKEATKETSLVQLFSSGGQKQQGTSLRTGASFILEGLGGGNLSLEVPKDADILWGDIFLYPSLRSSVIGSVYYIDTNSQSAFKTVYLRLPVNVFSSQFVLIENVNE